MKSSRITLVLGIGGLPLADGACSGRGPAPGSVVAAGDKAVYESPEAGGSGSVFRMDLSGVPKPSSMEEFNPLFHLPPVRQGNTGTCWSFATTSLFESELKRLHGLEVKLSEMPTAYWEYVEKARRFIRDHGESFLGEGSEPNAVILRMKEYGAVRESDYPGFTAEGGAAAPAGREHDHAGLLAKFS